MSCCPIGQVTDFPSLFRSLAIFCLLGSFLASCNTVHNWKFSYQSLLLLLRSILEPRNKKKSCLTGPFSSQLPSLKHSTTKLIDTGLKHAWCTCPSLDHVFITRSFRLGCPDRMWVEDQGGGGVKEYSRLLYSRLSRQSEYQGGPKETLTLSNSGFIHWGACYSS